MQHHSFSPRPMDTCWPAYVKHIQRSNLVSFSVLSRAKKQPYVCLILDALSRVC